MARPYATVAAGEFTDAEGVEASDYTGVDVLGGVKLGSAEK